MDNNWSGVSKTTTSTTGVFFGLLISILLTEATGANCEIFTTFGLYVPQFLKFGVGNGGVIEVIEALCMERHVTSLVFLAFSDCPLSTIMSFGMGKVAKVISLIPHPVGFMFDLHRLPLVV